MIHERRLKPATTCSCDFPFFERLMHQPQIFNEALGLTPSSLIIGCSKEGGWMHRRHHEWRKGRRNPHTALRAHLELAAEQRLCGSRAEAYDDVRFQNFNF